LLIVFWGALNIIGAMAGWANFELSNLFVKVSFKSIKEKICQ
jgi:hypothetical protein